MLPLGLNIFITIATIASLAFNFLTQAAQMTQTIKIQNHIFPFENKDFYHSKYCINNCFCNKRIKIHNQSSGAATKFVNTEAQRHGAEKDTEIRLPSDYLYANQTEVASFVLREMRKSIKAKLSI